MKAANRSMGLYHYTECGLDNVYLANGYKCKETPYGEAVYIEDLEGLHREIAHNLVTSKPSLNRKEFRFLRKELNLSQKAIGEIVGAQEQTVSLWERKEGKLPKYADLIIRFLYRDLENGSVEARKLIDALHSLDKEDQDKAVFEEDDRGWKPRAA